ncbi:MAG: TetR/AcrR family transcriptional regulator [Lachnospiraceae bacterium]|nr:TetR/AcrR family transcriptional regulator [Lachnospiraceae bacterium]
MGTYENARKATREKIIRAFWELYQEQPINKITVKQLTEKCEIHRGTFYIHFQDMYSILNEIEANLLENLRKIDELYHNNLGSLAMYGQTLYDCFQSEKEYLRVLVLNRRDPFFSQKYLAHLKEHVLNICIADNSKNCGEKELAVLDIAVSSIVDVLLYSICNSTLTIEEINELISGFIQNGFFVTLSNKFDIKGMNNPFSSEFWKKQN